jgi:magnesium-transporting ATPase (P-type)
VPAELRLIKVRNLRVDEAILTGESVPVDKAIKPVDTGAALGDRLSMAYSGTFVAAGQGIGVAVATGAATELGRISTLLGAVERLTTPLVRQMDQFARQVTFVILAVSALVFAYAVLAQSYPFNEAFMDVVGLSVAAIPEGLPPIMTIALAVGVQRMARRNAIIRRLPAVETLGAVSVICSDKTGTLTCNEMTVRVVATAEHRIDVEGADYRPEGGFQADGAPLDPAADPVLEELSLAALLCNDAHLRPWDEGWIDPPRPEAVDVVAECKAAGIRVKMITGDHAVTARAIVTQLGLADDPIAVTGQDLDRLSEAAFKDSARDATVFARTSPEHKLRLIEALQNDGSIIAMTGDGVNDAPALKRADVGAAMGGKGTEAAKEASEMVLADDNFVSIVAAVREGRTVYDNLTKVIAWTLPTNGGEALTIILAILFGLTLPVTPVQILWINMITAVALGITLALEPTEPNAMDRPARRSNQRRLSGRLLWRISFVSVLMVAGTFGVYAFALGRVHSIEAARTMVVNALVVMEIFYLFSVRYVHGTSLTWQGILGTPAVLVGVTTLVIAQFAFTYLPPMQAIFGSHPVSLADGSVIVPIGVMLFLIVEAEKRLVTLFERNERSRADRGRTR